MEGLTFTEFIKAIIELGFPVVLCIYLLVFQGKKIEQFTVELAKVRIALYLILSKMDAVDEYETKLDEYEARKLKKDG